ncbi:MAG: DUF835 domain-containing protein [Methanomassiliicoccales archaeon]|nr:MAG: DUF835 domain-containing protein [Methanomassiliicoccales archaeon]
MFSDQESGKRNGTRCAPSTDSGDQARAHALDRSGPLINREPLADKKATASELPDVEKSSMYLVEEERSEKSYELFEKSLARGLPGLCATRVYPEILRKRYDFGDCAMLWLSNAGKEDSIRPRDLERLSLLLEQFISTRKGVVLVDGIEYLITNNDFVTVLRLIQSLRDQIAMNLAIMIISLNPSTLGFQELNLLEREMDSILRMCSPTTHGQQDFQGR